MRPKKKRSQPQQPSLNTCRNLTCFGIGGKHNRLLNCLQSEREKFEALWTDSNDRQAFRIIRNFARRVQEPGKRFQNCRGSTLLSPRRRFCNFCESRWIANIRAIGFAARVLVDRFLGDEQRQRACYSQIKRFFYERPARDRQLSSRFNSGLEDYAHVECA